jgi:hypothetical protein
MSRRRPGGVSDGPIGLPLMVSLKLYLNEIWRDSLKSIPT